jgi:hypothetical protein
MTGALTAMAGIRMCTGADLASGAARGPERGSAVGAGTVVDTPLGSAASAPAPAGAEDPRSATMLMAAPAMTRIAVLAIVAQNATGRPADALVRRPSAGLPDIGDVIASVARPRADPPAAADGPPKGRSRRQPA